MIHEMGDRLKAYENCYRLHIPRKSNVIVRLDGKAFHTLTKKMDKPFDANFKSAMVKTAIEVCKAAQGCRFGFTQSDEISLLLTDYANFRTSAFFDNNVQKIASVLASTASVHFNRALGKDTTAVFDARVFTIPERWEVRNYFLWRQKDAYRNAILSIAQNTFGHTKILGKGVTQLMTELMEAGIKPTETYGRDTLMGSTICRFITVEDTDDEKSKVRSTWDSMVVDFKEDSAIVSGLIPERNEQFENTDDVAIEEEHPLETKEMSANG